MFKADVPLNLLPLIEPRKPGFNPYTHYGVQTRRGVKVKAKTEWAQKVVDHWKSMNMIGSISSQTQQTAYKNGWIIGSLLNGLVKDIVANGSYGNAALAQ